MKELKRSISAQVLNDLQKKIVLIAGPRQCGKTTLSKSLVKNYDYLNYDNFDDRSDILHRKWERHKELVIFDELHKMPKWKAWLKGIYDKEGNTPKLLVTGSARLNAFRKAGDSLAGRHFYFRLHPFDLKEVFANSIKMTEQDAFSRLMSVGGYPEPFLNGDEAEYLRWRQTHLDIILRQDLTELDSIRDVKSVEVLIQILRSKVGSGISVNALATDLQKDHKTVQRWLEILEDLFVIFRVTPYFKDISRAIRKEPKYYFYDTGLVLGDESQKLENLVACALLKELHYLLDVKGQSYSLHSLRVKGGREIDFALIPENRKKNQTLLIEVKWKDADASPNFKLFQTAFTDCKMVQLVQEIRKEHTTAQGIEVRQASSWLCDFSIM